MQDLTSVERIALEQQYAATDAETLGKAVPSSPSKKPEKPKSKREIGQVLPYRRSLQQVISKAERRALEEQYRKGVETTAVGRFFLFLRAVLVGVAWIWRRGVKFLSQAVGKLAPSKRINQTIKYFRRSSNV